MKTEDLKLGAVRSKKNKGAARLAATSSSIQSRTRRGDLINPRLNLMKLFIVSDIPPKQVGFFQPKPLAHLCRAWLVRSPRPF